MNIEFLSFLTLSLFIAITPGPSVIYVVSYSLRYGAKAGIVSTLGINVGSIVAILLAAFGLSTLLATYPNATKIIEIVGGLYMVYLAVLIWPRGPTSQVVEADIAKQSHSTLFRNGFITSVLNPKDIMFYTAFIPTFIPQNIEGGHYRSYFLVLAFSYMTIGFVTKSSFAIFAGHTKKLLNSENAHIINYLSGIMLFCLGVYLLLSSVL